VSAQEDLAVAYDSTIALGSSVGVTLASSALNDVILAPGVYTASAYLTLGGALTFDASGDLDGVFIITVASYLAVSPGAMMVRQSWELRVPVL